MSQGEGNVLIYGATGFNGRLIAAEGAREMVRPGSKIRLTLAARDGDSLRKVAEEDKENKMDFRVFSLDSRAEIMKGLDGFSVVINAAGPFSLTASGLADAALEARCHYVDINSEIDVYRNIDDLAPKADQRGVVMISGAGASAAASDVLLNWAISNLLDQGVVKKNEALGAVRIAVPQSLNITRGSAASIARSLREQVAVVRFDPAEKSPRLDIQMRASHVPLGNLERTFDFGPRRRGHEGVKGDKHGKPKQGRPRIASAVNMVDTLTAKHTLVRNGLKADTIESYVEMGSLGRIAYQAAGMLSPFTSLPFVRAVTGSPLSLLHDSLTQSELNEDEHVVVLEIEDKFRRRVVDWLWRVPNIYQFTAQVVVGIAQKIATTRDLKGWATPAQVLGPVSLDADNKLTDETFRGCELPEERQSSPIL
jgi:short subunit dehydrogenase-like uncharacterized protein